MHLTTSKIHYSTVKYNFLIECDVCIDKISVFMKHGFSIENGGSTNTDVGWYVNNLAHNDGKIFGPLVSTMVFAQFFSKLIIKKLFQMLRESRHENLKILIAPLNIKLSNLKPIGTVSTVVLELNNLYFATKINRHISRPKKKI